VALIAESRKSKALFHFLETGEMEAAEMDVGEAFQLLQIPDRTVDDNSILAAYSVCCSDAPGQIATYRKALSIIAREKQSPFLSSVLADDPTQSARALTDWPVGLNNIGNTCYLNSLLQFYFTITPLRNMVLDFENYKTDLDEENIKNKRVGSRKVSRTEIERSQKCKEKAIFSSNICHLTIEQSSKSLACSSRA
jgi:ubiquitin carboxyl-terminal hydrolase 25/28